MMKNAPIIENSDIAIVDDAVKVLDVAVKRTHRRNRTNLNQLFCFYCAEFFIKFNFIA